MIEIIPAIDLYQGQVVRLHHGDYSKVKVYFKDPLEAAKRYEDLGLTKLHMVDLEGARDRKRVNWGALEKVASGSSLQIDYSGGLKSTEDIIGTLAAGAKQVALGTVAFKDQELVMEWIAKFGEEKIIIGADCRERKLAISGWEEEIDLPVQDFIKTWEDRGASQFLVTSVLMDGALKGPDFTLYNDLMAQFPKSTIIASGGVSNIADIQKLHDSGAKRVIVGKAILEGLITIDDIKNLVDAR